MFKPVCLVSQGQSFILKVDHFLKIFSINRLKICEIDR